LKTLFDIIQRRVLERGHLAFCHFVLYYFDILLIYFSSLTTWPGGRDCL